MSVIPTAAMPAAERRVIVVGGSAGAFEPVMQLLSRLPADFVLPIVLVIHSPPRQLSPLAEALAGRCRLRVHDAEDKEPLVSSTVYV